MKSLLTKKNKIVGAFLGTIIEYYDYSLYGFSAAIIADKFFAKSTHLTNLINVFAIYAVAYLSKPIGSLVFGKIGDMYGRKPTLSITVIGMVIPTLIIGLLPEYSSIGAMSIIILSICRFVQGVFVGGEYDGAAIYVIEHLGAKSQYTASAITRFMGVLGLLLGIGCTNFFSARIFPDWFWRIPFLLSLPFALIALYYRRKFDETPEFQNYRAINHKRPHKQSLRLLVSNQWKIILMIIFLSGSFGVTYQVAVISMKQYLPIVFPQAISVTSLFSILIVIFFAISMPIFGLIADRYSLLIVIRYSTYAVLFASALFTIAVQYKMFNLCLFSCLLLAIFVAPFNALTHGSVVRLFNVEQRYRAVSLGHNIGAMLMSGSANYICFSVIKNFHFKLFPILYIDLFTIIYLCVIKLIIKITKK